MSTATAIRDRLLAEPTLTADGLGVSAQLHSRWWRLTVDESRAHIASARADLISDRGLARAERVHDWLLANVAPVRTVGPNSPDSYWLKHLVEDALDDYVANGTLILAATVAGYPRRDPDDAGPNTRFGMSLRDLRRLEIARRAARKARSVAR